MHFNGGSAPKPPLSAGLSPAPFRRLRLRALPRHWRLLALRARFAPALAIPALRAWLACAPLDASLGEAFTFVV